MNILIMQLVVRLGKDVSCLIIMHVLINLTTKCKTNLRNYLRNNLYEIYLTNYLQNVIKKHMLTKIHKIS